MSAREKRIEPIDKRKDQSAFANLCIRRCSISQSTNNELSQLLKVGFINQYLRGTKE